MHNILYRKWRTMGFLERNVWMMKWLERLPIKSDPFNFISGPTFHLKTSNHWAGWAFIRIFLYKTNFHFLKYFFFDNTFSYKNPISENYINLKAWNVHIKCNNSSIYIKLRVESVCVSVVNHCKISEGLLTLLNPLNVQI